MTVRVLCFGVLKDICGGEVVTLESPATVQQLLTTLSDRFPDFAKMRSSVAVAVNHQYASGSRELKPDDEIALLPPVSGGSTRKTKVALVRAPIVTEELLREIISPEDGALCTFEGVVRNNSRDRETLHLDYEAYEEMALAQMRALAKRAQKDFGIHNVVLVHRLGHLSVGETSVLIAVAATHRDAAFQACRWLIDTLKATVPIWKREQFADGALWADGEPFPEVVLR